MMVPRVCLLMFLACVLALSGRSANVRFAVNEEFFEKSIRPILADNCTECHGLKKSKGGLRLDNRESFLTGGNSGSLIDELNPRNSLILKAVQGGDPDFHMPPDNRKKLEKSEIARLEAWVMHPGPLVWPVYEKDALRSAENPASTSPFNREDRSWWAIQPVCRPPIPSISTRQPLRNPIDNFIAAKLENLGLQMSPEADRAQLFRRACLDLTGLIPTVEQLNGFLEDSRPDAWQRAVDRLLESPAYGERWAQHWLDVVRWAESDGYRADDFRPHAWPYRDYVIRSFNDDKPINRFFMEQLAGDEMDPDDPDVFIATAYLKNGIYEWNQREVRMQWDLIVNEVTDVTAEVFLGLGLRCARCHDHKFDPILQKDYYRFKALLSPIRWNHEKVLATPDQISEFNHKHSAWEEATASIRQRLDSIIEPRIEAKVRASLEKFPEDIQAMFATPPIHRTPYEQQLVELASYQLQRERNLFKPDSINGASGEIVKNLLEELRQFDHLKPAPLMPAHAVIDIGDKAPEIYMDSRKGRIPVKPGFLSLLSPESIDDFPESSADSTGRRLRLAQWIASDSNPFTARVFVNRIWQNHFGRGLVDTPNDFGILGGEPSHPGLLDWLTSEFIQSGWKTKSLHRLIMNSHAYRQSSLTSQQSWADKTHSDPENRLLWRFTPTRLSAEQIRDSILLVSGELDTKSGGPSQKADSPRRSVYIQKRRNSPEAVFREFNAPDGFDSVPNRVATTTASQALLLLNDSWPLARAKHWASRILESGLRDRQLISDRICLTAWSRPASQAELALFDPFLSGDDSNGEISHNSLTDLCHMVLSSNEFLYLH